MINILFTVSARDFYTAAQFASNDKHVKSLSRVHVVPHHSGGCRVFGLDGFNLFAAYQPDCTPERAYAITPTPDMIRACRAKNAGVLSLELTDLGFAVSVSQAGKSSTMFFLDPSDITQTGEIHEWTIPDCGALLISVLASRGSVSEIGYATRSFKLLHGVSDNVVLSFGKSETDPVLARFADRKNCIAVVMPTELTRPDAEDLDADGNWTDHFPL